MTAHSPVGLYPEKFNVKKRNEQTGSFANNDIDHIDLTGADHEKFGYGLKKSLFNYMHEIGLEDNLQKWFDFSIPKTTIHPDFIAKALKENEFVSFQTTSKIIWLGKLVKIKPYTQSKKGNTREMLEVTIVTKMQTYLIQFQKLQGEWMVKMLEQLSVYNSIIFNLQDIKDSYEKAGLEDFELFWDNKPVSTMYKMGLLRL